jgi:HEAT repeat protein
MVYRKLSNSLSKNSAKLLAVVFLLLSFSASASSDKKEVIEDVAKSKAKKQQGAISTEDMEYMRFGNNINGIFSSNYQIAEASTFFFEQRREKYVPDLIKLLKKHHDNDKKLIIVIYTLGRIGSPAGNAVPKIGRYLSHKNKDVRNTAMSSLGKIGSASDVFISDIVKFLEDDDEWTRTVALRSLQAIGTKQAKALAALYEKNQKALKEQVPATQPQPTSAQ